MLSQVVSDLEKISVSVSFISWGVLDSGHSHTSPPHTHTHHISITEPGNGFSETFATYHRHEVTRTTSATRVTINNSKSNIGKIADEYRKGNETRPKNMKVIWIIKCW